MTCYLHIRLRLSTQEDFPGKASLTPLSKKRKKILCPCKYRGGVYKTFPSIEVIRSIGYAKNMAITEATSVINAEMMNAVFMTWLSIPKASIVAAAF